MFQTVGEPGYLYDASKWTHISAFYHHWSPPNMDSPFSPLVKGKFSHKTKCIVNYSPLQCEVIVSNLSSACEKTKTHIVNDLPYRKLKGVETIFAITPTYVRYTQKVDMTSLCQTIMHVHNLVWIVVEDTEKKTSLVSSILTRCTVRSVQLHIWTSFENKVIARGVEQRNLGLSWIRQYCTKDTFCTGFVYFMDDDNKYDLRLFKEVTFMLAY